jgi:hypothetical protein
LSSSSVTSETSRRDVDRNGLKYFAASPASPPLPRNWRAKPLTTSWRLPRVSSSSVLKIWSRSTTGVVDAVVSVAPSSTSFAESGAGDRAM